jgi:hypothetical protein
MALLADRVKETTTTTGTGTITLAGAPAGFQSFNTAFANASLVYYVIQGGSEFEIGIGTVGTGTLARTQVLQSSNADALVPFSAGVKDVFCSYVADRAVTTVDAATLTNKTLDDYTNDIGANSTHFRIKATGTISKGSVVKATGYNPGEQAIEVAVVTSATDLALGIAEQALTTGQFGLAVVIGELFDINTNGLTVGAIIYSNGSGGYTETKPASGTYQPLGWVVRVNASNGVIAVNIVAPLYVEASTNTANTAVLRDGSGNFAAGTITASLTGSISGNAATATALQTARNINGVSFNGTADITVTAAAGTLTGTTLASGVTASSLTSVGTLTSLTVSGNTKIGNGVASNTSRLMVNTQNGTAAGVQLFQDGQASWILENVASSATLRLSESGVERMSINSIGNVAFDTNTLYVDAANNRVGVGTATPTRALDVVSGIAVNSGGSVTSGFSDYVNGGAWDAIGASSAGSANVLALGGYRSSQWQAVDIYTAGTSRLRVDASGNLGLGVTPSAWASAAAGYSVMQIGNAAFYGISTNIARMSANAFVDGSGVNTYISNGYATRHDQVDGEFKWFTAPSGTAGAAITFVTAMTLDASGRLLLGRTSGTYGVDLTSPDGNLFRFTRSTDELGSFISSNVAFFGTLTSTPLAFTINGTERARITSGGYFKASNTGPYNSSTGPYHEWRSDGVAGDWTGLISTTTATAANAYGIYIKYTAASPNGTGNQFLMCEDSTAVRATIRSNGGLANYQSNNVDLSDARTKTDITPAASMWGKVAALEIVTYKYNDQTHDDVNVGVIAQQVETVEPVWVDADGFGEVPADGIPLKTVYTKDITFAAIKALQEAMTRIETLEQRVLALGA